MTRLLLSLILLAGSIATVRADTNAEAEIHALIQAVAKSGCEFNRNGSLHSAEAAAEHLELKYSQGKRYAGSAEAFIDRLASKSSWSGKPYQMICDGEVQPAGDWLTSALARIRSSRTAPRAARHLPQHLETYTVTLIIINAISQNTTTEKRTTAPASPVNIAIPLNQLE